jgi:hypothetical protein
MEKLIETGSVLIGADPEVFLFDTNTQRFKSSIGIIGGEKWSPRQLKRGIAVQEDNVLAEFNISPADTREKFVSFIEDGISQINEILPTGIQIRIAASAFMPESELQDMKALAFGCDPDFNAWKNGKINKKPNAEDSTLRSGAGHIHTGFNLTDEAINQGYTRDGARIELVKWFDLYLGIPSLIMDTDTERRKLYGKAGCYRPKDYGVEYRTLSNFWLGKRATIEWAFDETMRAINHVSEGNVMEPSIGKKIEKCINTHDLKLADKLMSEFNLRTA